MKFYFFPLILTFLFLYSCDSLVDPVLTIEIPEHKPNLAVSAHLNNLDTAALVYVTYTKGILEPETNNTLEDVQVNLYEATSLIRTFKLDWSIDTTKSGESIVRPIFKADKINFREGVSYRLTVEAASFEKVITNQEFPKKIEIIDANYNPNVTIDEKGVVVDEIKLQFKDPPNQDNYYLANILLHSTDESGHAIKSIPTFYTNSPIARERPNGLFFSDVTFEGKAYTLDILVQDWTPTKHDIIEIQLFSISKDRFFFEQSLEIYKENLENPFSEPLILYENIVNGNGIFTLSNGEQFTIPIK